MERHSLRHKARWRLLWRPLFMASICAAHIHQGHIHDGNVILTGETSLLRLPGSNGMGHHGRVFRKAVSFMVRLYPLPYPPNL